MTARFVSLSNSKTATLVSSHEVSIPKISTKAVSEIEGEVANRQKKARSTQGVLRASWLFAVTT
jgi:hypothetical protein